MPILITGASGHLGRHTTELLLEQVDPSEVVLISRRPDNLSDLGVEARFGDFADPSSLDTAFRGVDRALIISTDVIGDRVSGHLAAIKAATRAGARHLLYTSIPNPTVGNPAPVSDDHRRTEEALHSSGAAWTVLRNGLYSEYLDGELAAARATGRLAHNQADGQTAHVARTDCAAVAAAILADPAPHANTAYDVTGPALTTADDRAQIYAELIGRPVIAEHLEDDAYASLLVSNGLPDVVAQQLTGFGRAIRTGALAQLDTTVERVVGRPALSIADVMRTAMLPTA